MSLNTQISDEASDWIVRHRNGRLDAAEKRAFDRWLRESPQHVRAYLEMSALWEDLSSLDHGDSPNADELIARARADDNVLPFAVVPASSSAESRPNAVPAETASSGKDGRSLAVRPAGRPSSARGTLRRYVMAASVLISLMLGGWLYLERGIYGTEVGEQRSLTLADGSTVELNARSRIRVRYTDQERRIELLSGEAFFHVAKNKERPFLVQTPETRIRAVGTAFDVNRASFGTVVTVVEGRVAAAAETPGIRPADDEILIVEGEQVVLTPAAATPPRRANVAAATAWTRHNLVFDASPLTDVAEEFNRYNSRPLVIRDPRLADFRISGVFSSGDPALLIRFLRSQPELIVDESTTEVDIRRK